MVLGLPIATFKLIYVIISLFAMFSGMMVVRDMRKMRPLGVWNPLFFFTTIFCVSQVVRLVERRVAIPG